eukprot:CAMPEP_0197608940 /NCGR_PEP_ID=MMETSP1326-20131121/50151_1 /TAXON_ID=1155430 /ORGANISM="Genus nov. species nov., Strain RCC2288" /LENGTH=50 /DNA_ID=CAMNT_0043177229 /DNA_START=21 /DNA_END=169 /DNA_ORIENTATION=-
MTVMAPACGTKATHPARSAACTNTNTAARACWLPANAAAPRDNAALSAAA